MYTGIVTSKKTTMMEAFRATDEQLKEALRQLEREAVANGYKNTEIGLRCFLAQARAQGMSDSVAGLYEMAIIRLK